LDTRNSNIIISPFFFFNVSSCLWCFHFCCVDNNNFCMSCGITFVMSSNPKLQLNLKIVDNLQELWSRMGGVCMSFANMYTNETLFARRCVKVHAVEDQTRSFVLLNLHKKLSLSCSPSTKSYKWSHKIIAISKWVYKPLPPCVTWGNHYMSYFWNGLRGGCCIITFNTSSKSLSPLAT
jgi:hypothetical protein